MIVDKSFLLRLNRCDCCPLYFETSIYSDGSDVRALEDESLLSIGNESRQYWLERGNEGPKKFIVNIRRQKESCSRSSITIGKAASKWLKRHAIAVLPAYNNDSNHSVDGTYCSTSYRPTRSLLEQQQYTNQTVLYSNLYSHIRTLQLNRYTIACDKLRSVVQSSQIGRRFRQNVHLPFLEEGFDACHSVRM